MDYFLGDPLSQVLKRAASGVRSRSKIGTQSLCSETHDGGTVVRWKGEDAFVFFFPYYFARSSCFTDGLRTRSQLFAYRRRPNYLGRAYCMFPLDGTEKVVTEVPETNSSYRTRHYGFISSSRCLLGVLSFPWEWFSGYVSYNRSFPSLLSLDSNQCLSL